LNDYNIVDAKSQSIIKKIEERMVYKEKLLPYIEKIYNGECGEQKIKTKSENKYFNFSECATDLWIDNETSQITGANFCKQRLCPVCNYRRSTMLWHKVKDVISSIDNELLLITLTVKNCSGENLSRTIDEILQSYHRISMRKTWKKNFIGFIRGLEITYNYTEDTFHPHIHILAVASKEYYKKDYVDVHQLRQWWTESARLDYYVQVDIRKVKDRDNAIAEVVKYSVKMADILQQGADQKRLEAAQTLAACIAGRRLMSTGGIIKQKAKEKNICLDDDDLDLYEKREKSKYYHYENGRFTEKNI
jgi:plasmid rolling circle replication initiator protein Rep